MKQKTETWSEIVNSYKPITRKEDYQVVFEECKKREIDTAKYKDFFVVKTVILNKNGERVIHIKCSMTPKVGFNPHSDILEFDANPLDFGFSKSVELLCVDEESGVLNFKTRKTENGFFVYKLTVTEETKHLWLFVYAGSVWVIDMKNDLHTRNLGRSETKELSNFKKVYPHRCLIPPFEVGELRKKDLIKGIYSGEGFRA